MTTRFSSVGVLGQIREAMAVARKRRRSGITAQTIPIVCQPLVKVTISSRSDGGVSVFIGQETEDAIPPIESPHLEELYPVQRVAVLTVQLLQRIAEEEGVS